MSIKNVNGDDSIEISGCSNDEMTSYKKSAVNVINFHLVYNEDDLEKSQRKFKPDMAHQIFGDSEMIFGYKNLSIDLYYLHNSAKCFVDLVSKGRITEREGCKADDFMKSLNPWLPTNYKLTKDDFLNDIRDEDDSVIFGKVIDTFTDSLGSRYKVCLCDLTNEDFKDFHQRFETYIVWYIDGANFIDLDDTRWTILYVYQEYKENCYTPVGFGTIYKFFLYPDLTRPRISQFFILPPFQKKSVGTKFYSVMYNFLKNLPDSGDITVEEPTEIFQKIRDYCDSLQIYKILEQRKINISTQNQKQINLLLKEYKICKRQSQRVFDILECLRAHKNGYKEYLKFTSNIKTRIANDIAKEFRGSKRLCNNERTVNSVNDIVDQAVIDAEYSRYIDSLEWPTNRLRAELIPKK